MVITRLEINASNGTESFKPYPIGVNIPVNINFNLADVREPDKRKASFSKTIKLPGTSEVNRLFENIFSVNVVTQNFNKNLKTPVRYIVDEIENFTGDLQLLKINLEPDGSIEYECSIIGEGGSLFVDIGEKLITGNTDSADDLDFSAYDHTYNRTTQISTRANAGTGEDVVYPFVDNGTNGSSDTIWNVTNFMPCFHLLEYITKIIAATGRTFTSSFLSSAEFKKLIVYPNMNSVALTQAQLENKQWYVGLLADATVGTSLAYVDWTDPTGGAFFDDGSQLDVSQEFIELNASGLYNVACQNYIEVTFTHPDPLVTNVNVTASFGIQIIKVSGSTTYILNNNSTVITGSGPLTFANSYAVGVPVLATASLAVGEQYYYAGEKIYIKVNCAYSGASLKYYNAAGTDITGTAVGDVVMSVDILSGTGKTSFYGLCTQKNIVAGDTMTCNSALPTKIKQKDLLKSTIQAYNLFVDTDPDDPNNLIIEPFEDFYDGPILNYENKTDMLKQRTVDPNILEGKRYIFSYKEDKDYLNEKYKEAHNEVFGTEQIDVDNDFIKADKKNELIFSPTPNEANYGLGIVHPRIYKSTNSGLTKVPFVPNIRLLIVGGVKQTLNQYTYKENGQSDLLTFDYLYAGHTDDPLNPTVDLNFGLPKEVYYDYPNSYFTTNNLYNRFHAVYLNNLIHRDSKFVTKYLWLSPKDIYLFSFRNRLFIDGAYYIVNKIENYNPLELSSTKCELIKLMETAAFSPASFLISDSPTINSGSGIKNSVAESSLSLGNNQNRGLNCIAIGENIVIPASCSNVTVIGNNVTVAEDVSNSSVINTNDYELIQSNLSMTNGIIVNDCFRVGYVETTDATPTKLVFDTVSGEFDINLDNAFRIEVRIIATDANTLDTKEWVAQGVVKNQSAVVTYNVVEAVTSTFSDAGIAAATIAIAAGAGEYLDFTATGIAATLIYWKCNVEYVRVVI